MENNKKELYGIMPEGSISDFHFPKIDDSSLIVEGEPNVKDKAYYEKLIYIIKKWAGFVKEDKEFEKSNPVDVSYEAIDIAVDITQEAHHRGSKSPRDIANYPDLVNKKLDELEEKLKLVSEEKEKVLSKTKKEKD